MSTTITEKLEELNRLKRAVDFNTYDFSVKEIVSLVKDNVVCISPDYQRKFRWSEERQSALIESILLGIPVPSIFMATNADSTWEVIDGVQRISTLLNFVLENDDPVREKFGLKKPLVLKSLAKLKSFEGIAFPKFPSTLKIEFLLKPLKVITLSDKSDKSVRYDLFERLNTGGVKLTEQEIRSCVYSGAFNSFLRELSSDKTFIECTKMTASQKSDGSREELVLRFFSYLYRKQEFVHSVTDFLNESMDVFDKSFDYIAGRDIFVKVFSQLARLSSGIVKKETRNVTSFVLFEAVCVGAAEAILSGREIINIDGFYQWVVEPEFNKLITGATNTPSRMFARIDYCKRKFVE